MECHLLHSMSINTYKVYEQEYYKFVNSEKERNNAFMSMAELRKELSEYAMIFQAFCKN